MSFFVQKSAFLNRWILFRVVFVVFLNLEVSNLLVGCFYNEIPCHEHRASVISLFGDNSRPGRGVNCGHPSRPRQHSVVTELAVAAPRQCLSYSSQPKLYVKCRDKRFIADFSIHSLVCALPCNGRP